MKKLKGPTAVQRRLIDAAIAVNEERDAGSALDLNKLLYQHTVLCQTGLPYRDPGDEARSWERRNGDVHLKVTAGDAMHPEQRRLVPVGLPFGPKARLVLMYINQLAIKTQSPHIEIEDSLTAFVRRVLKLDPKGRNLTMVKEQLGRLSAASITLGVVRDTPSGPQARTSNMRVVEDFEVTAQAMADAGSAAGEPDKVRVVESFNVWFPKDDRQRVLWPSTISLSPTYFETLAAHAVPLHETAIAALSHSALALDIYAWLAQRLHRIPAGKSARVSWHALYAQFGYGYDAARVDNFRAKFRVALREVLAVYRWARVTEDERRPARVYSQGGKYVLREPALKGLTLHHSPPPVPKRLHAVE